MAGHCLGPARPHPGAHRIRKDAGGLPLGARPRTPRRGHAGALRQPAQGPQLRRRAQPPRPARGHRVGALRGRAHRRHTAEGARGDVEVAVRHPDHDARVALPHAHVAGPRDAGRSPGRDRRRGARRRRLQARRAPRAQPGAAGATGRRARAAGRPLGHPAPARGDRPLRLGRQADRARGRGHSQGARPPCRRASGGHARARRGRLHLALDPPGPARARAGAPLHDRLRQQPPARRASRPAPQRARREGDRPGAPRLAGTRAAGRGRGAAQEGRDPLPRRHLVARARDRHGRGRPRHPGRVAQVGRARPAACGAGRAPPGRGLEGPHLPEVQGRPARVGRRRPADEGGSDRGDPRAAEPARRARAADRRDLRAGGDRRRRPPRPRAPRLALPRHLPPAARERPRHAGRPLSVGGVRRAAPAHHLGPHGRRVARPRGRAPPRRHERGDDPRPRALRRPSRGRRRARGRARRGDGLRGAGRPDVPARRLDVADRGDHARPRARLAGAGRARVSSLSGRARASGGRTSSARRSGGPAASWSRFPTRRRATA